MCGCSHTLNLNDRRRPEGIRLCRAQQSPDTSALAASAVSVLSKRQSVTTAGARQFILDHMLRAVIGPVEFDVSGMLDELRGHRLSVDAIIDTYVPAVACILGELWMEDDVDFATVTVGTMRLQSLLSLASFEALDFIRPLENAPFMLVVMPLGEQHSLGAFVLCAQLRRLGARVDMSFCETEPDLVSRVLCDVPDMVLFSASSRQTLETVSQIVQSFTSVLPEKPMLSVGGSLGETAEVAKDITGVDLVTTSARQVMTAVTGGRRSFSERKRI